MAKKKKKKWDVDHWSWVIGTVCSHSVVSSSLTSPWIVACQAPLFMGFPRKEYWTGLPFPSLGDLPDSGIEPASLVSPALQVDSLPLSHLGSLGNRYPGYFIFLLKYSCFFVFLFFLQCCVNFCHAAKWFSYICILFHDGLSQDMEYSSLCYTVGPCGLFILIILFCLLIFELFCDKMLSSKNQAAEDLQCGIIYGKFENI